MGQRKNDGPRPRRIQLPIDMDGEVGLGDVIKRMTSAVGIKPCGGCQKRAEWLNKRVQIQGRCKDCG